MANADLPFIGNRTDLSGVYVLVRSSLNVPVKDGVVQNQFRLLRGLTTISYLVKQGARVVMIGHISNKKDTEKEESLLPVYEVLKNHLDISFCDEVATPKAKNMCDGLLDGQVLLLENLRRDPREKKNDAEFSRQLADLAEVFVMDAFPAAHREHASVVGIADFLPSYAGFNFLHEYEELTKALKPKAPSLFMLGGAKFDTKLPLVNKFLNIYDQVFVGGALANDLFKAKGLAIGQSLVSEVNIETLRPIIEHPKLLLPVDITVMGPSGVRITNVEDCQPEEKILDAGPATVSMLKEHIERSKTILWNGPFGDYEHGFSTQTTETAKLIAAHDCYSLIGGGDTIASIEGLNNQEKFSFLSTAGGAMLTFLELGTLPAIEALKANQKKHEQLS